MIKLKEEGEKFPKAYTMRTARIAGQNRGLELSKLA
jgi:hypothetical protein